MKKPAIIIDLDGTLANVDHRLEHVQKKPKDFEKFHSLLVNDKPNDWCLEIVEGMKSKGYTIIYLTGRNDSWRSETIEWFGKHSIDLNPDVLFMRKSGDHRPDNIVKKEIYNSKIKNHYSILFAIDDRQQVVDMWRSLGITCLQCAEGDF